jgi:hypothetical protein
MKNYYNIDDAVNSSIDGDDIFIIANERMKKDKSVGRQYNVFTNFFEFLKKREKYKHCHEIFIDHKNNKPNIAGRLVFDFDIKYEKNLLIPKNFKIHVQNTIKRVIEKFYEHININILEFVWSSSENQNKLSKHLTVKNMYFENWIIMTKNFYQLFCHLWDKKYDWLSSDKLIDFQIIRKHASLRMVGSSKIGGNVLKFDDENYFLSDSLIRIYFENDRKKEQLITESNYNHSEQDKILFIDVPGKKSKFLNNLNIESKIIDPVYDTIVYEKAFELCNILMPGIYEMGKINGNKIDILRTKKHKCILSDKIHEKENAFLLILKVGLLYYVRFGCYRYCNKNYKTKIIGDILIKTNSIRHIECI